jgi:mRNA interferase HigB
VHVISFTNLRRFGEALPDAMPSLRRWFVLARRTSFTTMDDVVRMFAGAKALNGERARFAIHGGAYRLVIAFEFEQQVAYVKFIGTHADYDKIDALTVSLC